MVGYDKRGRKKTKEIFRQREKKKTNNMDELKNEEEEEEEEDVAKIESRSRIRAHCKRDIFIVG
jgi:hypothetical protein